MSSLIAEVGRSGVHALRRLAGDGGDQPRDELLSLYLHPALRPEGPVWDRPRVVQGEDLLLAALGITSPNSRRASA